MAGLYQKPDASSAKNFVGYTQESNRRSNAPKRVFLPTLPWSPEFFPYSITNITLFSKQYFYRDIAKHKP